MRVGIITGETHGTNYYRGTLIKRYLDRHPEIGVESYHVGAWNDIFLADTDLFFLLRPSPEVLPLERIHLLKRRNFPLVVDADDQIFDIPLWSPSSSTFRQAEVLNYYRGVYRAADWITTPSRYLYRTLVGCGAVLPGTPVSYIPNAFDTSYKLLRPVQVAAGPPHVGWAGGGQHQEDLAALEGVFRECLSRGYTLTFLGDAPRCLDRKEATPGRVQVLTGSPSVELYMQIMPIMGIEVGLAPLLDIEFNRCKSALKPVEYSWLCGVPSVVSDLPCYDEIEPSERCRKIKGFEVADWMSAIDASVAVTRQEGRKYELSSCYRMHQVVHSWVEAFRAAKESVRA